MGIKGIFRKADPLFDTQAERVVRKLGGAAFMSRVASEFGDIIDAPTISRWTAPTTKRNGCGGCIPLDQLPVVLAIARAEGILLTAEDLDPRPRRREVPHPHSTREKPERDPII